MTRGPTLTDELEHLIHRHRDEESPTLSVDWALLRLLDRAGTGALCQDLTDLGDGWEVCEATERLWENLPDQPGLYMFVWRPWFRFTMMETAAGVPPMPDSTSQILYIGQAGSSIYETGNTLKIRYKSYRRFIRSEPSRLWAPTLRISRPTRLEYLALRPLEYWFTVVEDRSAIKSLEARLLNMFNPPLNQAGLPKTIGARAKPATPAFT